MTSRCLQESLYQRECDRCGAVLAPPENPIEWATVIVRRYQGEQAPVDLCGRCALGLAAYLLPTTARPGALLAALEGFGVTFGGPAGEEAPGDR